MMRPLQILVSAASRRRVLAAAVVLAATGCGQKGPLYLPTEPAAAARATLPETLGPAAAARPASPASAPPVTGTAQPVHTR